MKWTQLLQNQNVRIIEQVKSLCTFLTFRGDDRVNRETPRFKELRKIGIKILAKNIMEEAGESCPRTFASNVSRVFRQRRS